MLKLAFWWHGQYMDMLNKLWEAESKVADMLSYEKLKAKLQPYTYINPWVKWNYCAEMLSTVVKIVPLVLEMGE